MNRAAASARCRSGRTASPMTPCGASSAVLRRHWLQATFDHTLLVSLDDPERSPSQSWTRVAWPRRGWSRCWRRRRTTPARAEARELLFGTGSVHRGGAWRCCQSNEDFSPLVAPWIRPTRSRLRGVPCSRIEPIRRVEDADIPGAGALAEAARQPVAAEGRGGRQEGGL